MQTPPEVLEIAAAVRAGKPLPKYAEASPGVYTPRLTLWKRFYQWIRPRRGCGCQKRKKWLNGLLAGLGDAVEFVTRWTGIKRLVDWWVSPVRIGDTSINDAAEVQYQTGYNEDVSERNEDNPQYRP